MLEHLTVKNYLAGHHCIVASVTKQYNLVPVKGVISLAEKVTITMGLVEGNGSLPPGL